MHVPDLPPNEQDRLKELYNLNILDTPIDPGFERIANLAQRSLDVPIVAISLIDKSRQWFKATRGLDCVETHRDYSFCNHAIHDNAVMVVNDASKDERFADNPLVIGDPKIRFYAGCPFKSPNNTPLGALCVIDRVPRQLNEADKQTLQDLAVLVEDEISAHSLLKINEFLAEQIEELEIISLVDSLTRLWNRRGMEKVLDYFYNQSVRENLDLSLAMLDIDNFKEINDTYGHQVGDSVLKHLADLIMQVVRRSDAASRWGGEEFLLLFGSGGFGGARDACNRLQQEIAQNKLIIDGQPIKYTVTIGLAHLHDKRHEINNITDLITQADKYLYQGKKSGKDKLIYN